jgi:hypothetical protein
MEFLFGSGLEVTMLLHGGVSTTEDLDEMWVVPWNEHERDVKVRTQNYRYIYTL